MKQHSYSLKKLFVRFAIAREPVMAITAFYLPLSAFDSVVEQPVLFTSLHLNPNLQIICQRARRGTERHENPTRQMRSELCCQLPVDCQWQCRHRESSLPPACQAHPERLAVTLHGQRIHADLNAYGQSVSQNSGWVQTAGPSIIPTDRLFEWHWRGSPSWAEVTAVSLAPI